MPQWMNGVIKDNPPNIVADCIYQEGKRQLVLLETNPEQREEISLAIHAIIYKADDLKLLDVPNVHEFISEVVCRSDIKNVFRLQLLFYIHDFGSPVDYNQPGWQERMVSELCS